MTVYRLSVHTCSGPLIETGLGRAPAITLRFDRTGRVLDAEDVLRETAPPHETSAIRRRGKATAAARADTDAALPPAPPGGTLRLEFPRAEETGDSLIVSFKRLGRGLPGRSLLTAVSGLVHEIVQLGEERDRLAAIIDGADFGTWEWNVQTGQTIFNDRWAEIVGYRLAELEPVGIDTWLSLCHPDDLEHSERELKRHFAGETDWYDVEARMRHKDGRWIWIRDVGRVRTRTEDGAPEWMFGVHRDIDDWKQRESQLRRSQELLERAGMLAGLGSWELDLRTGEIFWSDETCRIHGVEPGYHPNLDEAILYYAPEARPEVEAAVAAGITDGTPWDFELPLIRRTGERIWVRSVGEVTTEDGRPVRLNGAIQDISARKETERRLAEAAEVAQCASDRLNTLADNAPGALFEHRQDAFGRVDLPYFSARLPQLLGVDRDVMLADGAAAAVNIHPEDAGPLAEAMRVSHEALSPLSFSYRLNHPDKGLRWMQLSSIPFRQPDGAVIWFGNVSDVTEQSAAQRQLAETLDELRIAHARLNTIAENMPGALFEYRLEPNGATWFPYFTRRFPDLVGVAAEDLRADGDAVLGNVPDENRQEIHAKFDVSRQRLSLVEFRHPVLLPGGRTRWLNVWASPFLQPGGAITWFGKTADITDRLEIEARAARSAEEARLAHARINSIANIAPVGLFEYRRLPDGRADLPYTSARFSDLLGLNREQIGTMHDGLLDSICPEDRQAMALSIEESARTLAPWEMRFRFEHPQRGRIWLSGASTPRAHPDGTIIWTGALHDVTADVEREAELTRAYSLAEKMRAENEWLAFHDGLTGLPNRRYFDRTLDARMQAARSSTESRDCTLLQIDLDHFKSINDTLGHQAGDQVLVRVADVLRDCLREGDFAARLGGDEFSVILAPSSTRLDAEETVDRLRQRLNEPFRYRGSPCRISASFGIVHCPEVADLREELQLYADAALYRAKDRGRDRIEVFADDLAARIHDDRRLAQELQEALEHDQFEPWFQPQILARDGALAGVEALARWRHPRHGILSPDAFIKAAAHLGIVPEIDRIVMEKTCDAVGRWHERGLCLPKISFNVSSGRLRDPGTLGLARALACYGTQMALELVESICVEEEGSAFHDHLSLLRQEGIGIEIDDFGSGQTSIIGLMEIRPSALKIDGRLVSALKDKGRADGLVRAIVQMARALGITTIAEGVETPAQAEELRAMGCDILQGYLFSPPLDFDRLLSFAGSASASASASGLGSGLGLTRQA